MNLSTCTLCHKKFKPDFEESLGMMLCKECRDKLKEPGKLEPITQPQSV